MSKQGKVHPSTKDLNVYGGYEVNGIGSGMTLEPTKQNPSVARLNRSLEPYAGNDADYDTDHITSGPAKRNLPVGQIAQKLTRVGK